ncbi:hypothetical protein MMC22_001296 [Lobaria immixta]|nr:hypothetical protein [Lobaria immixta]
MAQLELSLQSGNDAIDYPRNVAGGALASYAVDGINYQLDKQAPRLFADETQAALDFLDLGTSAADKQDFYFSGFRQRVQLAERWRNNAPNARLVSKKFQLCYNLKSVEPSDTDKWSIRHCAVHHSFDVMEIRASWIIVKGDSLMKRRIESATSNQGPLGTSDFDSMDQAFNASLETHLIFCGWSAENWRWYINYLEDSFQHMTQRTFSAPVHVTVLPTAETDRFTLGPRIDTGRTNGSKFSMFSRTESQLVEKRPLKPALKHRVSASRTYTNPDTGKSQPLPPDEDNDEEDDEPESSLKPTDDKVEEKSRGFSFGKLRKVHKITEKANEAVLVLKQNINILAQLQNFYRSALNHKDFPKDLAGSCKDANGDFATRIEGLENDMQIQILRLETLLRLLKDRKTLVKQIMESQQSAELKANQLHSILDYQNTQANKYSTKSMFKMTEDMNDIARKTKIETVSMKVITLVTLFFLPGTFISSLMSTDVFQSHDAGPKEPSPHAHLNPLQLYLVLSLPLTVVTLLFWAGFHFHEKQKERHHKVTGWQA